MQKYQDIVTIIGPPGLIPVVGANVYVYDTGTNNLSSIYTDNSSTRAANPLTSDNSGRFNFYAADGVYDLTFVGPAIQTYTQTGVLLADVPTSGVPPTNVIELDAENEFGITAGTGLDCTQGWLNFQTWLTNTAFQTNTNWLINLPHGLMFHKPITLTLPDAGGSSAAKVKIQGSGVTANGTVSVLPQDYSDSNAPGQMVKITGAGYMFDSFEIDGWLLWNRWNNAPSYMIGWYFNIDFGSASKSGQVALMEQWRVGRIAARSWPGTRETSTLPQIWFKGGQTTSSAPIQKSCAELIADSQDAWANPLSDGVWFTGEVGPFTAKISADSLFQSTPTNNGLYLGSDRRSGLVVTSVNSGSSTITFNLPHMMKTGDEFQFTGGTPWGGNISPNTSLYAIVTGERTLQFNQSLVSALARTPQSFLNSTTGTSTVSMHVSVGTFAAPNAFHIAEMRADNVGTVLRQYHALSVSMGPHYAESIMCLVNITGGASVDANLVIYGAGHCIFGTGFTTKAGSVVYAMTGYPYVSISAPDNQYYVGYEQLLTGYGLRTPNNSFKTTSLWNSRTLGYVLPTTVGGTMNVTSAVITGIADTSVITLGTTVKSTTDGQYLSAFPRPKVISIDSPTQITTNVNAASTGSGGIVVGGQYSRMGSATQSAAWTITGVISQTCTTHNNTTVDGVADTSGLVIGTLITGPGIFPGTAISTTPSGGAFGLSSSAALNTTAVYQFANGQLDLWPEGIERLIRLPTNGTDTSPNITSFITGQMLDGCRVSIGVASGTGDFWEFDTVGDTVVGNIIYGVSTNRTVRVPSGAQVEVVFGMGLSDIGTARVVSISMPPHTVTWTPGVVSTQATVTTTIACKGARVGDLMGNVGAPATLGGLSAWSECTTTNVHTLYVYNPTTSSITAPAGTWKVIQTR